MYVCILPCILFYVHLSAYTSIPHAIRLFAFFPRNFFLFPFLLTHRCPPLIKLILPLISFTEAVFFPLDQPSHFLLLSVCLKSSVFELPFSDLLFSFSFFHFKSETHKVVLLPSLISFFSLSLSLYLSLSLSLCYERQKNIQQR